MATTTTTPAPIPAQAPAPVIGALTPSLGLIPAVYVTRRGAAQPIRLWWHRRAAH